MRDITKRLLEVFLTCHFMISIGICISGLIMEPDAVLRYDAFIEPAIMALLCTLPTLLTLHTDELSMKQLVLRKLIQVIIVEGIILSLIYFGTSGLHNLGEFLIVFVAVLLVFAGVSFIDWIRSYVEAKQLNQMLMQMKHREM